MFHKCHYQLQIGLFLLILLLSLAFRVINLDHKVFWVDEVATVLRAAGYTKAEITEKLADGAVHTPAELLAYQALTPERSLTDAIAAFRGSPEHAPFYFLLIRVWMQQFGSSVVAVRSFSVVCSLLLLPSIYWLSQLLFRSRAISGLAVALTGISPLLVAYAQEARPYSLWLLLLVVNGATLLRALERNQLKDWGLYALMLTLSLYTSLLTIPVVIAQSGYVYCCVPNSISHSQSKRSSQSRRFGMALLSAVAALFPWLWLVSQHWQTLQDNTTWMRLPIEGFAKGIIWFYSVAIVYFDVPILVHPPWAAAAEVVTATGVVALIGYAFYYLCRQTPRRIWLFVLSLSLPIPLLLILLDLISNGRYSTAPRYLLPFHLGTQLAVAYLLINQFNFNTYAQSSRQLYRWRGILLFLIMVSLISNLIYLDASPRYLKNRNLHNFQIAALINQASQPVLWAESSNTLDLLSLSHSLNSDVRLTILPTSELNQRIQQTATAASCQSVFLFNPSASLRQHQPASLRLEEIYHPQALTPSEFALSLWKLRHNSC